MIRTLWNRLGSALRPRQRTQTKPKPIRWRPHFDVLEDRVVPAIGLGTLEAPLGSLAWTGVVHNPTHWKVQVGDTITGTISGATDAVLSVNDENNDTHLNDVQVIIKSSEHGNTFIWGTIANSTITFTWTVPDNFCETTIVAYNTVGYNSNNDATELAFFSEAKLGRAAAGYAIVDSTGKVIVCGGGGGVPFSISGIKFFDANGSGAYESGTDGLIAGWTVYLDNDTDFTNGFVASVTTDGFGSYTFSSTGTNAPGFTVVTGLGAGTWYVYEGAAPSSNWFQTMGGGTAVTGDPAPDPAPGGTSGAYTVVLTANGGEISIGNNFGNLKEVGGTGGKTLGFWTNKNGQTVIFDGGTAVPELTLLNGLNLVTASGGVQDFDLTPTGTTGYSQLRTWLLNANATNMAYMLSAQLAANALAVEANLLSSTAFVNAYTHLIAFQSQINATAGLQDGGLSNLGYISIRDLQKAADAALAGAGNLTLAGDPLRAYQEALKTVLDLINNNQLNFIGAC